MARALVIVESPTKSQTIGRYLDSWRPDSYRVASSVGHIIDLPEKELGVDIKNGFKPTYVHASRKTKVINQLKKLARESEEILLATDQDREGEAIAWHIANLLRESLRKARPIHRIRFNEITRSAIIEAVQHPDDIDQQRVNAQQARRIMDRLVGYQVSPLLWKTVSRGLSAGRVQSVAVRLICEREEEIGAFVPQEYWTFEGSFESLAGEVFPAALQRIFESEAEAREKAAGPRTGRKPEIHCADEAAQLRSEMEAADYRVHAINEKEVSRKAPPPFITSTLQQDAARRLGFSPKKTMTLAQQLYEGVELADGERAGLITYMRTDSMRLAESAVNEAREWIVRELGEELVPRKAPVYRGKGKAQDAHEAVRPTEIARTPDSLGHLLGRDQLRLYKLIWSRFAACQMVPALYLQRSIDLLGGRFLFRTTGSRLVRKGFLEVYGEVRAQAKGGKGDRQRNGKAGDAVHERLENGDAASGRRDFFPPTRISEGEALKLLALEAEQHFTKPPARFSQESLIRALEELGIGRPSTYASIVDMILKRQYVELKEKRFRPSELGITVNRILVNHFADIFNVDFTARMETELDSVENGRPWQEVLDEFYGPFAEALSQADARRREIKQSTTEQLDENCPECEAPLVSKWGRNGRFIACSAFPTCRYTRNPDDSLGSQESDQTCELCGSPMLLKTSRYGRFLGCSAYPKCKNTKPLELGIDCPNEGCEGRLVERRSRRGRVFYGCSRYPECRYASWDKPVCRACPACEHPWMLQKQNEKRGEFLKCPACKTEAEVQEAE